VSLNGAGDADGGYSVRVGRGEQGWEVRIVDEGGSVGSLRACAGEGEARTFASTVNQHLNWLSAEKFREYYRLGEPA
jgi:hypothetical protein